MKLIQTDLIIAIIAFHSEKHKDINYKQDSSSLEQKNKSCIQVIEYTCLISPSGSFVIFLCLLVSFISMHPFFFFCFATHVVEDVCLIPLGFKYPQFKESAKTNLYCEFPAQGMTFCLFVFLFVHVYLSYLREENITT